MFSVDTNSSSQTKQHCTAAACLISPSAQGQAEAAHRAGEHQGEGQLQGRQDAAGVMSSPLTQTATTIKATDPLHEGEAAGHEAQLLAGAGQVLT